MKPGARTEIRVGGTGGQGLILAGKMLAEALASIGKRIAQSQTYEPTSRGGYCNADLVVSEAEIDYPLATALDHLVLLDHMAIKPSWPLVKPGALLIADTRLCPELPTGDYRGYHLPLTRTAIELGSERVANIVALGALVALGELCDRETVERAVRAETPKSFLDLNMDALSAGYKLAAGAALDDATCQPTAGGPYHGDK